ncbi:MAG TPA: hypothetical protein VGY30_01515 [Solirubrobacteraceae bacterium]|jgi:uncharacterized repeat protein (TIGR01451 family)|nr:hypothetical protein [Solirubrobacteraceae bacterium]
MSAATNTTKHAGILTVLITCAVLLLAGAAPAAGAPAWQIESLSNSTVQPGGEHEYIVQLTNPSSQSTTGEIEVTGALPAGMTAEEGAIDPEVFSPGVPCTAGDGSWPISGASTFKCVYSGEVQGKYGFTLVKLKVSVDPAASGVLTSSFKVSGGGLAPASRVDPTLVASQAPGFGLDAFDVAVSNAAGTPYTQAGGHPETATTSLDFNTVDTPAPLPLTGYPVEPTKDVVADLPAGFIGNPTTVDQCTTGDLLFLPGGEWEPLCAASSQVGTMTVRFNLTPLNGVALVPLPLYNIVPPAGASARFATVILGTPIVLDGRLRNDGEYAIAVDSRDIPDVLGLAGITTTFWGRPGSSVHDGERACPGQQVPANHGPTCVSGKPGVFLRNPTSCTGRGLPWALHIDSWDHPGAFTTDGAPDLTDPAWKSSSIVSHQLPGYPASPNDPSTAWGPEVPITGCEEVPVKGNLQASPTAIETETPTGLTVHVEVPNPGLENPEGISASDIKGVKVTLPQGVTINPSQAEGLGVCTPAQYASTELSFHPDPAKGCPSDSKIGTVVLHSLLLNEEVDGNVYIAKPFDNPFGSLLALYLVLENPQRGILVKQEGKVETDPVTGQITTTFSAIPQLPFSSFDFKFREGARAPLVTPALCGTYETNAVLTPWSNPSHTITSSSTFQIVHGIGGGACPSGGVPPFVPQVISGSQNNNAASYTPFYLHITRQDGEQELTKFTTVLPPGLTGNLTGIPFCSDAAIETARHKMGAQELAEPSCPAASEIGHTIVGAGVGSVEAHTPGKVYLAGSYHGSNLSIVSITSATVGPFDLGTVVIRFGLRINPTTAQVEVDSTGSDPIPHIIDGIVVHVRDIHVYMDRPNFIRNPTSCDPLSVTNTITGAGADYTNPADQNPVSVNTRFQAANCSLLGFKPSFKVSTSGKTSRANGASLTVKLTYPKAPDGSQANIAKVKVDLPRQLPSRLTTLQKACTDRTFNANPAACPAASRVGIAKAITPILPEPLTGPAYFVSHGGAKFPELIVVIQGYGFTIDLHGETFISPAGITSSTFRTVPDQPVTSFELTLPQGPNSALAANGNLCKSKLKMPTAFTAQNGVVIRQTTSITATGCGKAKRARKGRASRRRGKGNHNTHAGGKR